MARNDVYFLAVLGLVTLARWLPRAGRALLGDSLGSVAFRLSVSKRRAMEENLDRALGTELGDGSRDRIVRESFRAFWHEMLSWSTVSPAAERRPCAVRGLEHLVAASHAGKGAILWESNGFGPRLLAKRILARHGWRVHQVHGPNDLGGLMTQDGSGTWVRRAWVKAFFRRRERTLVDAVIDLPASTSLAFTRPLLQAIERNAVLCIAADGRVGHKLVPVPFLGARVPFAAGMVSLARMTGAPLLPLFCTVERGGATTVEIEEPICLDAFAGRDVAVARALEEYARRLERRVKRQPGLYRNWHLVGAPTPVRSAGRAPKEEKVA